MSLDKFLTRREGKTIKLRPQVTSVEDGSSVTLDIEVHSASSGVYRNSHTLLQRAIISRDKPKTVQEAQKRTDEDLARFMCAITVSAHYDDEELDPDTLYKLYYANPELVKWLDGEANNDTVFIKSASESLQTGAPKDSGSGKK